MVAGDGGGDAADLLVAGQGEERWARGRSTSCRPGRSPARVRELACAVRVDGAAGVHVGVDQRGELRSAPGAPGRGRAGPRTGTTRSGRKPVTTTTSSTRSTTWPSTRRQHQPSVGSPLRPPRCGSRCRVRTSRDSATCPGALARARRAAGSWSLSPPPKASPTAPRRTQPGHAACPGARRPGRPGRRGRSARRRRCRRRRRACRRTGAAIGRVVEVGDAVGDPVGVLALARRREPSPPSGFGARPGAGGVDHGRGGDPLGRRRRRRRARSNGSLSRPASTMPVAAAAGDADDPVPYRTSTSSVAQRVGQRLQVRGSTQSRAGRVAVGVGRDPAGRLQQLGGGRVDELGPGREQPHVPPLRAPPRPPAAPASRTNGRSPRSSGWAAAARPTGPAPMTTTGSSSMPGTPLSVILDRTSEAMYRAAVDGCNHR